VVVSDQESSNPSPDRATLRGTLGQVLARLKSHWGVTFLVVLALLYLVPYYLIISRGSRGVTEIYFADRITEAHRILIDRYNKAHAGKVKVVPIDFPNSDFSTNERKEILARSLRGEGDGIDLLAVDLIWVDRFARWCEPLGPYFTKAELDSILPEALYSCYSDGKLMALPLNRGFGVMFYREDLLRQEPHADQLVSELQKGITWSQFAAWKERLQWKNPFYVFPAAEYEGLICAYIETLLSIEPEYFSLHGFNFETKPAREALQVLVNLVNKDGLAPPVVSQFTEVPSFRYFIKNDGLFVWGWTSYDEDFRETPVDPAKEAYLRMVPPPHPADGVSASIVGGWNLMIPTGSTKKAEIIDFVKYLLTPDAQELMHKKAGFYPVIKAFYSDSTYLARYPEITEMKRLMSISVHRPSERDYTKYSEIMAHFISLAIQNRMSVDSALTSINEAIRSERTAIAAR
jgi:multiple sugar transport system substrate-binding protein